MPASFTPNSKITLPANGEESGTWGNLVNNNMNIIDRLTGGGKVITLSGATGEVTTGNGTLSDGQYKVLIFSGALSEINTVTFSPNTCEHVYFVKNTTAYSLVFTQGSGSNVTVLSGKSATIYCDGAGLGASITDLTTTITLGAIDSTPVGINSRAAGDFTYLNAQDGLSLGGTFVTATAPELNLVDGSLAGTVVLGKAVVYSSEGKIAATTIELDGAALTPTSTEINYLSGVNDGIQEQLDTLASGKVTTLRTVTAGSGLDGGGALSANISLAHSDTSTQASVNNSGLTVIQDVTLDGFGHVTALGSTTISIPDTLGVSQAYGNFAATTGTWYTNNVGRAVAVFYSMNVGGGNTYVRSSSAGTIYQVGGADGDSGTYDNSYFIVPNGHQWRAVGDSRRACTILD
tara:strand:- start:1052 stop:2266 length:1215 start_codon:yes stop_codon:yes gene_type:complete